MEAKSNWSEKNTKYIYIAFAVFLVGALVTVISVLVGKHSGKGSHENVGPVVGTSSGAYDRVRFGLCVKNENNTINLSSLKSDIDHFWNWKEEMHDADWANFYKLKENEIEFLPMVWGSGDLPPSGEFGKGASQYPVTNLSNYLMLWNEPDMVGGCVDAWENGMCKNSTSSGYWLETRAYGCLNNDGEECTKTNVGFFKTLVKKLNIKFSNSTKILVSPSMAQHATGTCYGYLDDDPHQIARPRCGPGKDLECVCHGWLMLLKETSMSMPNQNIWDKISVISIHAYYDKAHYVKAKILHYLETFKEDIQKGKTVWLTETAYVCSTNNNMVDYVNEAADFADDLLRSYTSNPTSFCEDAVPKKYDMKLPGLLSREKFRFLEKEGTWYDHGFRLVSWFCVDGFPNFPNGCNNVTTIQTITSFPYTNGKKNKLFEKLFPKS